MTRFRKKEAVLPGGYSWAFSNIMPCIMWHDDATKKDSEYPTKRKELSCK